MYVFVIFYGRNKKMSIKAYDIKSLQVYIREYDYVPVVPVCYHPDEFGC